MSGKIYFVSAPGRIKIGFTSNPESRLRKLRNDDMEPLEVIGIADGNGRTEHRLHDMVRQFCIKGEWFRDCPEVRAVINDFLNGKLVFDKFGQDLEVIKPRPIASDYGTRQNNIVSSALAEASALCEEITQRIARREPVSDLVRSACFLTEKIIVPEVVEAGRGN